MADRISIIIKKYWAWGILVALFAAYSPYLGTRFIRTGGDEKVYVNQAMEMARDGSWFVQTIGDQPAYYKGPVHYVLLRIGTMIFGRTPWSVLYMNFLFLAAGAIAVGAVVRRRLPEWEEGPLWAGLAFGLCVGVYSHAFASQMEVELTGTFAVALYLLDRLPPTGAGFLFWCVAGFAGWIKAPLHSAFLGTGALIYWALTGQFAAKARNPKAWAAALTGVLVGVAGYLPAFIADQKNFVDHFIIKEIAAKSSTGQSWWTAIVSTYGFYLFPWVLLGYTAYLQFFGQLPRLLRDRSDRASRDLLALVAAFCFPSVAFFIYHPYRFENYNMPSMGALILLLGFVWSRRTRIWELLYSVGFAVLALVFLVFAVFVTILSVRFSPLPAWWPGWLLPVVWIGMGLAIIGVVKYGVLEKGRCPGRLALATVAAYWALGAFFSVIGEREMVGIRQYLAQADQRGEKVTLSYYNLMGNIWNEWGLLNFWIDRPVRGLNNPEQLKKAIESGDTILLPSGEGNEGFRNFVAKEYPGREFVYTPWKRWQTHGGADTGKPLWREAWDKRDSTILERDFFIVKTDGR